MERWWWCVPLVMLLPMPACLELSPVLRAAAGVNKTGCFVVVLNKESNMSTFATVESKLLDLSTDSRLYGSIHNIAMAITVALNDSSIDKIRSFPEVAYIEEETLATGMQDVPWHLDRLDQNSLPLNQQYWPLGTGKGVDLYIVDSGINFSHEEFENRAKFSGHDPMDSYLRESRRGTDCNGHGTHVASLAAGKRYGVAKGVRVYSVRVLDCDNAGPWSVVLDGLDHVSMMVAQRGRPAVLSMSLGGDYFRTVNNAVRDLHSSGLFSASAAGNERKDACTKSPASSPFTLTVAGSSRTDNLYFSTNFGQCVDIFSPSSSITGADHTCATCSRVLSGTSMGTPMVSGAAAILLSQEPLLKPQALRDRLIAAGVHNTLVFSEIPSRYRTLTRNTLLQVAGQCGGVFVTPVTIVSPNYPGSYPHNLQANPCQWTVTSDRPGSVVQCNFTNFETEAGYDEVTVCDGAFCCPSSFISTISGNLRTAEVYSSRLSSSLTLSFATDGIVSLRGFRVSCSSGSTLVSPPPSSSPQPVTTPPPTSGPPFTVAPPPAVAPPPIIANESCSGFSHQFSAVLSDLMEETTLVLQELVNQSLSGVLMSKIVGQLQDYPASGCPEIARAGLRTSGLYWVLSANGSAVNVYCDLSTSYSLSSHGYMRVAHLNMTESSHSCPPPLQDFDSSCGKRLCGRGDPSPGCSSVFFPTHGVPYTRVCGSVVGYQFSNPNAFLAHQYDPTLTLDDTYLDGVSLTYGPSPRSHIWSFAAAISESSAGSSICPCSDVLNNLPSGAVPSFVKQSYFCDTGNYDRLSLPGELLCDNPLWDGLGCGDDSTCCERQDYTSWFCTDLNANVTDDIELRVCGNENTQNEDTPLESVYLYVQ